MLVETSVSNPMPYKAIEVSNLAKRYSIPAGPSKRGWRIHRLQNMDFWALNRISFDVETGEIVGIIGRNGAGKSTLLKILSRITAPTRGLIQIRGRMASLLEVGTGFHPELTGRENIFLNGSILGMSRGEIRLRFDEIVAFSEIEQFLNTPVKHYSSGMYVRLAFAVAAHLNPEIMVVDEVLAVGDLGFQKKCLGKMQHVSSSGKTILLVSHNLAIIRQMCRRAILVDSGCIVFDGATPTTLLKYHELLRSQKIDAHTNLEERRLSHTGAVRFAGFSVIDVSGRERYEFKTGELLRIQFRYQAFTDVPDLVAQVAFRSLNSNEFVTNTQYILSTAPVRAGTEQAVTIEYPSVMLCSNEYSLYLWLGSQAGASFDRIDYTQNGCPILNILSEALPADINPGYFQMPSRLLPDESDRHE